MERAFKTITYMLQHDPSALLGFVLLGAFAVFFTHVQFKMREIGYKTYPLFARPWDWTLPSEYLRVRAKQNWSPWPVYLMWPCLALGIILLFFGVARLQRL